MDLLLAAVTLLFAVLSLLVKVPVVGAFVRKYVKVA